MPRNPVPEPTALFDRVEVIRSSKRRKTVQARLVGETVVVRIPAHMSAAEEKAVVAEVLGKLRRKATTLTVSDTDLVERADALNATVLDGRATWGSIRWVSNQHARWGSCTPAGGDIRISDRLLKVPAYVLDAVIVHELVHTFIAGHTAEFYAWADRAPHAERARGYLEAYQRWGGP